MMDTTGYDFVIVMDEPEGYVDLNVPQFRRGWKFTPGKTRLAPMLAAYCSDQTTQTGEQVGNQLAEFFLSHMRGDWGDVCADDRYTNNDALRRGMRVLSCWMLEDETRVWIITDGTADDDHPLIRPSTTLLLPEEY